MPCTRRTFSTRKNKILGFVSLPGEFPKNISWYQALQVPSFPECYARKENGSAKRTDLVRGLFFLHEGANFLPNPAGIDYPEQSPQTIAEG